MKAIIFRVFDHGANSPTNDRFSTFARSLTTKNGTKIETVASTPSCFYKERSLLRHASPSNSRNVYYCCLKRCIDPRRKNDISGYI